ncbi:MAG TPA: ABC transporter permease subunit [Thermoanaerobaculia bacterium]|nr:ABC transporter permease subunit [Thermoanaerobaculia bacterium]
MKLRAFRSRADATDAVLTWRAGGKVPPSVVPLALAFVLAWLVGYPLLLTLLEALRGAGGWTLRWFLAFFARQDEWLALWRSLWISLASVFLAAAVGVPLAFVLERTDFPGRRALASIAALPVALPPLVGVIAFLFLYGESGFVSHAVQALLRLDHAPWRLAGPGAILLVHTYSFYVYFYLFTRAGLARLDGALLEAAAALGAGRGRTLWRVTLPLLRPALVGGALLTLMTALASFSAPYLFGGGFRVMPTQILASKLNGEREMAQVETVMLALLALAGLWLLQRGGGADLAAGVRGIAPARHRMASPARRAAAAAVGYALALVLLLPHLVMVLISLVPARTWIAQAFPPVLDFANYAQLADRGHLRPVVNSLWMAAVSTAAALAIGFAAARAAAGRKSGRMGRLLETLVALPWAIPGTVFAVALATTFSVDAPWLGRFVLVGTPWILPLAYLVRSLPLTGRAALAGLRGLDPALEEAAAGLGAGRWRSLARVTLPLLRPALAAGAGLAFITALGDFVVSIVLYTFDTRPIAIEILSNLQLQDLGMSAVYGVLLMAGSTAAFFLWGREPARRGA